MRWEGERQSENIEDRRKVSGKTAALGGGAMLVIMLVGALFGLDPRKIQNFLQQNPALVPGGGGGQAVERPLSPEEERTGKFAATILAFTEEVWDEQFRKAGKKYEKPKMVLFSEAVQTRCGNAPSSVGPFYCPGDRTVYLDPTFFDELERKLGGSAGEFSQAYVIAHEVGHHVQKLLGYSDFVDEKRRSVSKEEFNTWSVRLELQADYLAGVWAHYGQKKFQFIEDGDIESAMKTAQAIGDDRLQKNSRGFTSPESYTHGTSAQRAKWFRQGLQSGDLSKVEVLFKVPYNQL